MEKYQFDKNELTLMERSSIALAVYQFIDRRVVTLVVSDGFCRLFGYERDEAYYLMDNDMYRDTHPDDAARIADAAFRFAVDEVPYNVLYRTKTPGGYRVIHAIGNHRFTSDGTRLAIVSYTDEGTYAPDEEIEDGLQRSFSNMLHDESLFQHAYYDRLTGLPNMDYFFELAEAGRRSIFAQGKQVAFLFFDLSGMKFFNERYGFAEGNKLIKAIARVLVEHFSNENCARFGQDHFAVFTVGEDLEGRLRELLFDCEHVNGENGLPLRVGIYLDPSADVDVSTACDRARAACNVNRHAFMSSIQYFDDNLQIESDSRRYIIHSFELALSQGWIKVYYQPIVRAANGRVCDEESLARWIDPVKGLIPPAEFIPALEDSKLIYRLDLYILEETLKKMNHFKEEGLFVVPSSLNLSRVDFDECDMVEEIRRRVDAANISHDMISIEITESVIGGDLEFMKKQVKRFHELGFKVWMDDFGSGYSSLDLLQSIHFDTIKFDMLFMRRFEEGDRSKIILTELVKMAVGLGIETLVEGVEHKEHVDFLRSIGCNKLQGFYYTKPLSVEEVLDRYRTGRQIGFENPAESAYFSALGGVNLYDLSVVAHEDRESFKHYFDTIPMAIYEVNGDEFVVSRCNNTYREYLERQFGFAVIGVKGSFELARGESGSAFLNALEQCAEDGQRVVVDEQTKGGETIHSIIKRVAKNPVTGTVAVVTAVLAVVDAKPWPENITYAEFAKALSSDYKNLFYVNLLSEEYIEYDSSNDRENLAAERRGTNFFETARHDAKDVVFADDLKAFLAEFTKEKVVRSLDEKGVFALAYRQLFEGEYRYVSMKIARLGDSKDHIIIGVNDVDERMRQREALEKMRADQVAYSRINALAGGYISIYSVDPETERYHEYSATRSYEGLGLAKEGENFFGRSVEEARRLVHPDDYVKFRLFFNKVNVMREIERNGLFVMKYRLILGDEMLFVRLKVALVEENGKKKLIAGVNDISRRVRQEQEYAGLLAAAKQ